MNELLPQQYYVVAEHRPLFWPGIIGFLTNAIVVLSMVSMVSIMVKKILAGEEAKPPF